MATETQPATEATARAYFEALSRGEPDTAQARASLRKLAGLQPERAAAS